MRPDYDLIFIVYFFHRPDGFLYFKRDFIAYLD